MAVGVDRVAGMIFQPIDQRGTHAKYVAFDAALLTKAPGELTLQQTASVPLVGPTASGPLEQATGDGVETLLVTGPLGDAAIDLVGGVPPHAAFGLVRTVAATSPQSRCTWTAAAASSTTVTSAPTSTRSPRTPTGSARCSPLPRGVCCPLPSSAPTPLTKQSRRTAARPPATHGRAVLLP